MYNLLIVEDEPIERQGIKLMVENNCSDISAIKEAENGLVALELIKSYSADIVMMDINMPGLNGLETIREMKKICDSSHFIILTSHESFSFAYEAIQLGVEDYILKPAKISRLMQAIDDVIIKIEKEKRRTQKATSLQSQVETIRPVIEKKLLNDIVLNVNADSYKAQIAFLEINARMAFCIAIGAENLYMIDIDLLKTELSSVGVQCISDFIQRSLILCVFCETEIDHVQIKDRVSFIQLILQTKCNIFDSEIGVSASCVNLEHMHIAYKQAESAKKEVIKGDETVCFYVADMNKGEVTVSEKGTTAVSKNLVGRALEYINEGYKNNISLNTVSEDLSISPYYLSKLIKKHTGINFPDLINEKRIVASKKLLSGKMSIKEIAYTVGFQDQNYFAKTFKKHTGMTPTEYKDLQKK